MMLALRGTVGVVFFDQVGKVMKRLEVTPNKSLMGLDIHPDTWHAVFPLTDKSIILEIKEGPYCALEPKDFASWVPVEGSSGVGLFLDWVERARVGNIPPEVAVDI